MHLASPDGLAGTPATEPLSRLEAELARTALRSPDRQALFDESCRVCVSTLGLRFAWVGLMDDDGRAQPVARSGDDGGYVEQIRANALSNSARGRGPTGEAMRAGRAGRAAVSNDFLADPATAPWHEAASRVGIAASCVLPLRERGRVVATLNAYAPVTGFFSAEVVASLMRAAEDLSAGLDLLARQLEHRRVLSELDHAAARWRYGLDGAGHGVWEWDAGSDKVFFSRVWKAQLGFAEHEIGDSLDEWRTRVHPDDLAGTLAAIGRHFDGTDASYRSEHRLRCKDGSYKWILDQGRIVSRSADGKPAVVIGTHTDIHALKELEQRYERAESIGRVGTWTWEVSTGDISWTPGVYRIFGVEAATLRPTYEAFLAAVHPEDRARVTEALQAALRDVDSTYEVVHRVNRPDGSTRVVRERGEVTRDARGVPLRMLGAALDVTEQDAAERAAAAHLAKVERASYATLAAITQMMDLRDPYTAGHERRVGELAAEIARELGLAEDLQRGLRFAGMVHDVGKILVPSEILAKPTKLTKPEYELIKTHAQVGYDILKDVDFPWPVAEVARQHHERIDGSGYPRGLKGDEILLEARITAVADVLESMASHRPYRPSRGIDVALAEIEQGAGRAYDPVVAAAALRLFRERGYVLPP